MQIDFINFMIQLNVFRFKSKEKLPQLKRPQQIITRMPYPLVLWLGGSVKRRNNMFDSFDAVWLFVCVALSTSIITSVKLLNIEQS